RSVFSDILSLFIDISLKLCYRMGVLFTRTKRTNYQKESLMSVEPLEKVIQLWESEKISLPQAIGKILLWLRQIEARLRKLEATQPRSDDRASDTP
ncbi:MAG TPA: hypothetical protein PKE45_20135, partial [Caldilineaceae bacterium]|nr:hypothetical protein [Caldilineaceae bacterium]